MTCKDCIHENLCVIKAFPSAFENTHWDKEPCDHFKDKSKHIELPCKIGDAVWRVRMKYYGGMEIGEGKISMIMQKSDKSWKIRYSENSSVHDFSADEIGTGYFFSREEAESALKERLANEKL